MLHILPANQTGTPLVCVYGVFLRKGQNFPEDRLCDYIYFDSIIKDRRDKFGDNPTAPLDYFLSQISRYRETGVGVSISVQ